MPIYEETRLHYKYVRPAIKKIERVYTPAELDQLIADHIDPHPDGRGVGDAVTRDRYVPVWSLIGYVELAHGDLEEVADGFCIAPAAVRAALTFYARYRQAIQARIMHADPTLIEVSD